MRIIHLSDTHFGNRRPAFSITSIKEALSTLIDDSSDPETYLVISGDVTFQGQCDGYKEAEKVIKEIWSSKGHSGAKFLACPGNHDICQQSFEGFDAFQYAIRRTYEPKFEKSSAFIINTSNISFLLLNTAQHLDHKFGLLDIEIIKKLLETNKDILHSKKQRIAVLHHHLVGHDKNDLSTVRNALPLLQLLDNHCFSLILHGHRHSIGSFKFGESGVQVFSTRSMNFTTPELSNGISTYTLLDDIWHISHHTLSKDNNQSTNLTFSPKGL